MSKLSKYDYEPTSPFDSLASTLCGMSIDISNCQKLSWIYGIVIGWNDECLTELSQQHNWDIRMIERLKYLHQQYQVAKNLFSERSGGK